MKRWNTSHSSIAALLAEHPGARDPERAIRERARALVAFGRSNGWEGPPFDPEILAELRSVRVRRLPSSTIAEAAIVPDERGRFTILVNQELPKERELFGIAHEVTHTLFPDCAETIRLRGPTAHVDRDLEILCDIGASEILFPEETFVPDLDDLGGPSLDALEVLHERYGASWEATANRMVCLSEEPMLLVLCDRMFKPSELRGIQFGGSLPPAKLRVEYAVPSIPSLPFLPKYKSLPDDTCLHELLDGAVNVGATAPVVEDWSALGLGEVDVQGRRLPDGRLLGLVRVL